MDELVQNKKQDNGQAIQVHNDAISPLNNTIKIVLQHSKTYQRFNRLVGREAIIQLKSIHKVVCRLSFIRLYLQLMPKCGGHFFHIAGGVATRYQIVSVFKYTT